MTNLSILVLVVAVACTPLRAWATDARGNSDAPLRNRAVTFNPLALAYGAVDAQIELRRTDASALAIRADIGRGSRVDWSGGSLGAGAAWRMYPDKQALRGLYWGPGGAVSAVAGRVYDLYGNRVSGSGFLAGPTVEAGYQFVLDGGFAADLGMGAAWYFGTMTGGRSMLRPMPVSGLQPFLRLAVGYAWR